MGVFQGPDLSGFLARTFGFGRYLRDVPDDLIGTTKLNGGSVARDKRAAAKARNQKRHKRASK
ncbi:hypothetical protein UAM5_00006 [Ralstonia phage UAM5]|nr:hypothetical protein UAM5_00006 [Ralstonia phage UAM5]